MKRQLCSQYHSQHLEKAGRAEEREEEERTEALSFNVKLFDSGLEDLPYVSSALSILPS